MTVYVYIYPYLVCVMFMCLPGLHLPLFGMCDVHVFTGSTSTLIWYV